MKITVSYKTDSYSIECKDVIIIKDGYLHFWNNGKVDKVFIKYAREIIIEERKEAEI